MKNSKVLPRRFFLELWRGVAIVRPVPSGLLVFMGVLGLGVGRLEGWPATDGPYFSFVTGLFVAVCVQALQVALGSEPAA